MQRNYSRSKLVSYIVSRLATKTDEALLSRSVAAYLIACNKTQELESVMRDAQELRAKKDGIVELTAASAHDLGPDQVQQIEVLAKQQYSGAKEVKVHQKHDETVIGGVNLTLPQASLDISVRNKLNQLREAIS